MPKWKTTKFPGVRCREHKTRKHGIRFDQYFAIRYQKDGKRKEEGVGWASEGWSAEKAALELAELKAAATTGKGASRFSEAREKVQAEKDQATAEKKRLKKELISFGEYFDTIYYPAAQAEKKAKTHAVEEQLFRIWIRPVIGEKPLKKISSFDIERIKKKMLDAGRAPRTVEYCFTVLGLIFRYAIRTGHHEGEIPTTQVKKLKYDNKRVRFLSVDEAHTLLAQLKILSPQVHAMAIISLHCGLRAGEIFSLTWGDVDIKHGLVSLFDTKSSKTRTLSITAEVEEMLCEKGPGKKQDFVFPNRIGERTDSVSRTFPRTVKKIGFNNGVKDRRKQVTFHTLRHTFASWLVMEGVSLYEVKELLGHASITMTERYAHLAPDRNRRAAETLGNIFARTEQKNGLTMAINNGR